jgi:hypothetical protein
MAVWNRSSEYVGEDGVRFETMAVENSRLCVRHDGSLQSTQKHGMTGGEQHDAVAERLHKGMVRW